MHCLFSGNVFDFAPSLQNHHMSAIVFPRVRQHTHEHVSQIMSGQIAQILSNHATHEKTVRTRDYYASFLRASRSLGGMTSMHALIPAMETTVKGLLRCSKCTVYTHDRENNLLFTLDAAGREHWIGVSDKTVAGWVCLNAKATRIGMHTEREL